MKEKIEQIFEEYLGKLKDLMEYKALITLPNALLNQNPKIKENINVKIDYSLFSPVPIEPMEVDMNNFDNLFSSLESKYLNESCIEKLISIYEMFLFDIMKETFIQYPMKLSSNKQINVSQVLYTSNRDEIIYVIIHKELDEIKYQSMEKWHGKLCELLAIPEITVDLTNTLKEIKSTRDIIVHNNSIVNDIYIYKAGEHARGNIGDTIDVSGHYFKDSWVTVASAILEIKNKITAKYG